jgi:glucokinase
MGNERFVGFDLGGTKMMSVVFDDDYKVLGRGRKKSKAFEGAKAGIERICATIHEALDDAKADVSDLGAIGIAAPGQLDLDKGVIIDAPNLGWSDVKLAKALEDEFKCPVVVSNDVDAGVYGEYTQGAARDARCVVGVFPGTGIGGGCIYEGRIMRGKSNSCMEIGHIQVQPDGPLCGCGQRGCLEAVSSRLAISAAVAIAAFRGEAPHIMAESGTDLAEIRSGALAEAIEAGDKAVERIVREAARWIGVGVSITVNLLAPDVILLGGGLVEAMPGIFRKEVEDAARAKSLSAYRNDFKVVVAKLGDDATATGAAAWARASTRKKDKKD